MCSIRRTLAASLLLALAACGGKHNTNDGFDGGSSSYALTLVGSANYVLHPTDKRTLQVLLSQDQVGPVANASIHFEFQDGEPEAPAVLVPGDLGAGARPDEQLAARKAAASPNARVMRQSRFRFTAVSVGRTACSVGRTACSGWSARGGARSP